MLVPWRRARPAREPLPHRETPPGIALLSSLPGALLAIVDAKGELDARTRYAFRLDPTDALLILGVLVVLASLLFFWAFYVRKRPRQKHGVPIIGTLPDADSQDPASQRHARVRRKRRRHHPDNFPRNPTLGETGGLPPLRPEEESVPPEGNPDSPKPNA